MCLRVRDLLSPVVRINTSAPGYPSPRTRDVVLSKADGKKQE